MTVYRRVLFSQRGLQMPKIELYLPASVFEIQEIEGTLRISFPYDCSYNECFFYFPGSKEYAAPQAGGWRLRIDGSASITILNLFKRKYDEILWEFLAIQIERYLREKEVW